jgi:hypothetical protein
MSFISCRHSAASKPERPECGQAPRCGGRRTRRLGVRPDDHQRRDGKPTVTISHEVLEMTGDALIDQSNQWPDLLNALFLVQELCDPFENDSLAYDKNGVKVSDLVRPTYVVPSSGRPMGLPGASGRAECGSQGAASSHAAYHWVENCSYRSRALGGEPQPSFQRAIRTGFGGWSKR